MPLNYAAWRAGKDDGGKTKRLHGTTATTKIFRGTGTRKTGIFDGMQVRYNHIQTG